MGLSDFLALSSWTIAIWYMTVLTEAYSTTYPGRFLSSRLAHIPWSTFLPWITHLLYPNQPRHLLVKLLRREATRIITWGPWLCDVTHLSFRFEPVTRHPFSFGNYIGLLPSQSVSQSVINSTQFIQRPSAPLPGYPHPGHRSRHPLLSSWRAPRNHPVWWVPAIFGCICCSQTGEMETSLVILNSSRLPWKRKSPGSIFP